MENQEFEYLKNNKNGLIAFNTFLSTSIDSNISIQYAMGALGSTNGKAILFEFDLSTPNNYRCVNPFASLKNISYFEWEDEILFSMHAVFRVREVKLRPDGIWHIVLTMAKDDHNELQELMDYLEKSTTNGGLASVQALLYTMGYCRKALEVLQIIFNEIPSDDELAIANIQIKIGQCYLGLKEPDAAQDNFEKAMKVFEIRKPTLVPLLCRTGLGYSFYLQGKYDLSLQNYESFLRMDLMEHCYERILTLEYGHECAASVYNGIAKVLQKMKDHKRALAMNEKALQLYRVSGMPMMHPVVIAIYTSIALCHMYMKNFETALPYFRKCLEAYERVLPENHRLKADTHYNIAMCLQYLGVSCPSIENAFEFIEHAKHAIDIVRAADQPNSDLSHFEDLWSMAQNTIRIIEGRD